MRRDTSLEGEGYREPRRLTLWMQNDVPVKLVATEPNDAGLMTGESIAWFRGGEVRVVQEPFAFFYFDVDRLVLWTSGGGGYGDPRDRPVEAVLDDVLDGKVSVEAAEREYGVAIVNGSVDVPRTHALREGRMPAAA